MKLDKFDERQEREFLAKNILGATVTHVEWTPEKGLAIEFGDIWRLECPDAALWLTLTRQ